MRKSFSVIVMSAALLITGGTAADAAGSSAGVRKVIKTATVGTSKAAPVVIKTAKATKAKAKPVAKKPVAKKPVAKKAVTKKAVTKKPSAVVIKTLRRR